jgi:catechol 2,3-dioxygenase-like lactoylglutathione lyase family enzyme
MKLNHLNLTVTDVTAARLFLEKYFGMRNMAGENRNIAFLTDDDGFVLTLLASFKGAEVSYPPNFHIGFCQPSEEAVNEIYRRMTEDGIVADPPKRLHGWTYYVEAPGGFTVEVLGP